MSHTKSTFRNIAALAVMASAFAPSLTLSASAEERHAFPEITGEEIVRLITDAGGTAHVVRDPETGVIDSISACGPRYEPEDPQEIIERLIELQERASELGGQIDQLSATAALPKKIVGDLAQTSVTLTYLGTGSTTSASTAVTLSTAITGLAPGAIVSGAGIASGTTITAIAGTAVTLSTNATATGAAVALTFTAENQVIGLGEWTLSWKRKTVEATTTDDATYESSLPSTASWSVKAKYMFLVGDTSQSTFILASITAPQSPQYWNFFPDIAVGHPAFSGYAYVDGIDIAAGAGKLVALDTSLKGTGPLNMGTQLAPVATTNTVTALQAEV